MVIHAYGTRGVNKNKRTRREKTIMINRLTNIARYSTGDDIRRAMRLFGKEDWEDRVINPNVPTFVPNYHQILGKSREGFPFFFLSPFFFPFFFRFYRKLLDQEWRH